MKIGVPSYFLDGLDPDIEKLFHNAIRTFEQLGAKVTEVSIPELTLSTFAGYVITTGEAATYHFNWLQEHLDDYARDVRIFFQAGAITTTPQYVRAQQARRTLVKAFKKAFEHVDILAAPTIPITTPRHEDNWVEQNLEITRRCMPFTSPANATGTPSLSVPMGLCSNGLPTGMQLIGNHLSEKLLLQIGHAWEQTLKN